MSTVVALTSTLAVIPMLLTFMITTTIHQQFAHQKFYVISALSSSVKAGNIFSGGRNYCGNPGTFLYKNPYFVAFGIAESETIPDHVGQSSKCYTKMFVEESEKSMKNGFMNYPDKVLSGVNHEGISNAFLFRFDSSGHLYESGIGDYKYMILRETNTTTFVHTHDKEKSNNIIPLNHNDVLIVGNSGLFKLPEDKILAIVRTKLSFQALQEIHGVSRELKLRNHIKEVTHQLKDASYAPMGSDVAVLVFVVRQVRP